MLHIHRADRADALIEPLARVLNEPVGDPFAVELIAVPAKGIERWLTQQLARHLGTANGDGVAANIDFGSPTAVLAQIRADLAGRDIDDDPWRSDRLVWTVLAVIRAAADEQWAAPMRRDGSSEFAAAARITSLLRGYLDQRPAMVRAWVSGDRAGLTPDHLWQPELLMRVIAAIGELDPASRLPELCQRLRDDPSSVSVPQRVSVFGATRLSRSAFDVLAALAHGRDVHLWLTHPSPAVWPTSDLAHPLLASAARDITDLARVVTSVPYIDHHYSVERSAASMLARLQRDLRENASPIPAGTPDDSLQIHGCHGPTRQVEVLRELLLGLFQADPTLEPRDVVVMCPDIDTYAPLIRASFGQHELGHPGHRLRVRLADRGVRHTNPLIRLTSDLLRLADARITVSELLDIAALDEVRRHFGWSLDDLDVLRQWSHDAGARWGLTSTQRRDRGIGDVPQNTFTVALDRILLGVAADEREGDWLDVALPLHDVESTDIELAGTFAEFADRIAVCVARLRAPQPARAWITTLLDGVDMLATPADDELWQRAQLGRVLDDVVRHSDTSELTLRDARSMLSEAVRPRPTRANFRTGDLTMSTLVPMRSVPHPVVILLGLDDDVFPRGGGMNGDDLLALAPEPGERDARREDRQLFLDALCAAERTCVVLYSSADPVTGAVRPPATPVAELLDVLGQMTAQPPGALVTRHPLQPFDAANFTPSSPRSFDVSALSGARAQMRPLVPTPPFLPAPLAAAPVEDVDLADLVAFYAHPTQAFLRQRLGIRVPEVETTESDAIPLSLSGLDAWDVGSRMLTAVLGGREIASVRAAEWRRGTLPPFALGGQALAIIQDSVQDIASAARQVRTGSSVTVDIRFDVGGGRLLRGSVAEVYGETLVNTSYSRVSAKARITAWISLLALAANEPRAWQSVTIGRGRGSRPTAQSVCSAPEDAAAVLAALVALRDDGLREPLPLFTETSEAYARRYLGGADHAAALDSARTEFTGSYGELTDRHIALVHSADALDDRRFADLALTLWQPLLARETQRMR